MSYGIEMLMTLIFFLSFCHWLQCKVLRVTVCLLFIGYHGNERDVEHSLLNQTLEILRKEIERLLFLFVINIILIIQLIYTTVQSTRGVPDLIFSTGSASKSKIGNYV